MEKLNSKLAVLSYLVGWYFCYDNILLSLILFSISLICLYFSGFIERDGKSDFYVFVFIFYFFIPPLLFINYQTKQEKRLFSEFIVDNKCQVAGSTEEATTNQDGNIDYYDSMSFTCSGFNGELSEGVIKLLINER
ncbi:MAG: hypothetical protein WCJ11_02050 [Methylococcaceae bacterium]